MKATFAHVCREYDQCGEIGDVQKDGVPCFITCGIFLLYFINKQNHPTFLSTSLAFILLVFLLPGGILIRSYRLIVGDKWMTYKSNKCNQQRCQAQHGLPESVMENSSLLRNWALLSEHFFWIRVGFFLQSLILVWSSCPYL